MGLDMPIMVRVCGHHYRTEGEELYAEGYGLIIGADCEVPDCPGEA